MERERQRDLHHATRAMADLRDRHARTPEALWSWVERVQEAQGRSRRDAESCLGAIQTPEPVARLMAQRLLRFPRGTRTLRLLDAGCGSGRLLVAALRTAARRGLRLDCEGVETDAAAARWAQDLEPVLRTASGGRLGEWQVLHADFLLEHRPRGVFDALIANPPYVPARGLQAAYRRRLRRRYPAASRGDLSALFLERMLGLLRPEGRLCVIVPNKLLAADYAAPLRRQLFEEMEVEEIWDLSGSSVFTGRAAYPVIVVACRRRPRSRHKVTLLRADGSVRGRWSQRALLELPQHVVPLDLPSQALPLLQRLLEFKSLGEVVSVGCGIATSGFHRAVGQGQDRIICSGDIGPFRVHGRRRFAAEKISLAAQSRARQQVPKVIIPGMFQRLHAAFDAEGDLLGRVYFVPVATEAPAQRLLLLALLNSRLYDVLYRGLFGAVAQSGGYVRLNAPYLRRLPWPARPLSPELVDVVRRLERRPATEAGKERLNRGVEDLFDLSQAERQLLSRLDECLRLENEARPRTARKLPGPEAAVLRTGSVQSV